MNHEKALYQYLLENFWEIECPLFIDGETNVRNRSFEVNLKPNYSFEVCERQEDYNGEMQSTYYFDDRSDQGFDPITAREALELLKGE